MPDELFVDLTGRAVLVTGGSRGLGFEISRALLSAGASVMICAREADRLEAAGRELRDLAGDRQVVSWQAADVSDPAAVAGVVEQSIRDLGGLHVLVSNAGIYGPFGAIEDVDLGEWVRAIEVDLFGSVFAMRAVLPHFKSQRHGKIIQLSGGGATSPLPRISAYAVAKAGIVRFVETVAAECQSFGIDVNAIAPGMLDTRLLDEVLAAGPDKVGPEFFERATTLKQEGGIPLARGAELVVFLAATISNGITGKLISALWDDWLKWPDHVEELNKSDVYTLRRIAGRDRGLGWGDI